MANPITVIMNPPSTRALVFNISKQSQLTLSQTPLKTEFQQLEYSSNGTPKGNHATNQCLTSVYLRGMPTVFGKVFVSEKKVDPDDDTKIITTNSYVLAQLSPITNILAKDEERRALTSTDIPALAAASDNGDKAWFYYLRRASEKAPPKLTEAKLNFDSLEVHTVTDIPDNMMPSEKSRLACLYVEGPPQTCIVFFQLKQNDDNKIYYVTVGGGSGPVPIANTQSALDGTPISVLSSPDGATHVYWMTSHGDLKRSTRATPSDTWTTVDPKVRSPRMLKESQIASVFAYKEEGSAFTKQSLIWYIDHSSGTTYSSRWEAL